MNYLMNKCYKNPFLSKVIVRIDFTATIQSLSTKLNQQVSDVILSHFPIPESKEAYINEFTFSNGKKSERVTKQVHYFFHGKERDKLVCITPEFLYLEIKKYETYNKLKEEFFLVVDALSNQVDFSINRFGLRFINQIKLEEQDIFNWSSYLDEKLLSMLDISEDKSLISRSFSNHSQQYDDGMMLNFQYGMHNPDFPSRIKKKIYILDYDAYYQGKMDIEDLKKTIDLPHLRIETLFESCITQKLRDKMEKIDG